MVAAVCASPDALVRFRPKYVKCEAAKGPTFTLLAPPVFSGQGKALAAPRGTGQWPGK